MTKRQALITTLTVFAALLICNVAFAQDAGDNLHTVAAYTALAQSLGLGLAAAGGGLAQGIATKAALEGIARNPGASGKIFTPMILGLALIESLVIYTLLISFFLNGHLSNVLTKLGVVAG
jgi:F-type H+-transporting ATPase subunit c